MSILGAMLVDRAGAMRTRLAAYTAALVKRPSQLAGFVEYVEAVWPHLDPMSAKRQALAADLSYMTRLQAIYAA
jgi:hypothetical protein